MTTVGFIGSGYLGGTVARLAVAAGYDVVLSNSREPQTLKDLVEELGPRARAASRSWTRSTTSRSATGGYRGWTMARCPAARCSSGTWVPRTW
jgi:3-hydroxyacyl-CoA dehydrogenase